VFFLGKKKYGQREGRNKEVEGEKEIESDISRKKLEN
jgi:hypothetical protein